MYIKGFYQALLQIPTCFCSEDKAVCLIVSMCKVNLNGSDFFIIYQLMHLQCSYEGSCMVCISLEGINHLDPAVGAPLGRLSFTSCLKTQQEVRGDPPIT